MKHEFDALFASGQIYSKDFSIGPCPLDSARPLKCLVDILEYHATQPMIHLADCASFQFVDRKSRSNFKGYLDKNPPLIPL